MLVCKPRLTFGSGTNMVSQVSGGCWNRLNFYSSVAMPVLPSVQPVRLSKNLTSGKEFDYWKKYSFLQRSWRLVAPASYCEPGLTVTTYIVCDLCILAAYTCTCTLQCACTCTYIPSCFIVLYNFTRVHVCLWAFCQSLALDSACHSNLLSLCSVAL